MEDLYQELGLTPAATPEEIRRAFRVLARRYHPDVNPGLNTADKFKKISAAYEILGNAEKKRRYDQELKARSSSSERSRNFNERGFKSYKSSSDEYTQRSRSKESVKNVRSSIDKSKGPHTDNAREKIPVDHLNLGIGQILKNIRPNAGGALSITGSLLKNFTRKILRGSTAGADRNPPYSIAVVEVPLSVLEALRGVKKTIQLPEGDKSRKVSVEIPPAVRTGSVIRLKAQGDHREELVAIVKVEPHPFLSLEQRGLVISVPVTLNEAICGGEITVPTPDGMASIKVQPGAQSGDEIRIIKRGALKKDGTRGDVFCKLSIKIPESTQVIGLNELALEMSKYYGSSPRKALTPAMFAKDNS